MKTFLALFFLVKMLPHFLIPVVSLYLWTYDIPLVGRSNCNRTTLVFVVKWRTIARIFYNIPLLLTVDSLKFPFLDLERQLL